MSAPSQGTYFPLDGGTDKKTGDPSRSTMVAGRQIIVAALKADKTADGQEAAGNAERTSNWRKGYMKHYMKLVRLSAVSPEASLGIANAGLQWARDNLEFSNGKKIVKFGAAMAADVTSKYETGKVQGTGKKPTSYKVPYDGGWHPSKPKPPPANKVLEGDALKAQLNRWAKQGVLEADAATGINYTIDYFASGKSLSNHHFVMIGAGSAMGPFSKLLEMGGNIVAIDIPGAWGAGTPRPASGLWKRLIETAKSSPGSITFPLEKPQSSYKGDEMYAGAGADLMAEPARIRNWLVEWQKTLPAGAKVIIGNYTYLDGERHVKLAICADECIDGLRKARPETAVAFLCTPTDIHCCSDTAAKLSRKRFGWGHFGKPLEMLLNLLSGGTLLKRNALSPVTAKSGKQIAIVDGMSVSQGPNYALAKRMQHWRAQKVWSEGGVVSSTIAPSTATLSVLSNKTFAWA